MGYFSAKQVDELIEGLGTALDEISACKERVLLHGFDNPSAWEYAVHGIARRLDTLSHCCTRVYDLLPPEQEEVPEAWDVKEATVHIQSFISNIIGVLDNLAWVWIIERRLKRKDGEDFAPRQVKLSKDCRELWKDLPTEFRAKIVEFREWFEHVYEWRDALVHRIPLYIPPYSVRDVETYNELEAAAHEALLKNDLMKYNEIDEKSEGMKFFAPLIKHSFSENSVPAVFHADLISDMRTVALLVSLLLSSLDELEVDK